MLICVCSFGFVCALICSLFGVLYLMQCNNSLGYILDFYVIFYPAANC